MITAVLIDAENRTARNIELGHKYEDFCRALNCKECNSYMWTPNMHVVFDAEASLKSLTEFKGSFMMKQTTNLRGGSEGVNETTETIFPVLGNGLVVSLHPKGLAKAFNGATFDLMVRDVMKARVTPQEVLRLIGWQTVEEYKKDPSYRMAKVPKTSNN